MAQDQSGLSAIAGALWDLRDHAYDHSERWADVTPEAVFQTMAEIVERIVDSGDEMEWTRFPGLITASLLRDAPTDL